MQHSKVNIAIFSSGSGTNAQQIIEYFKDKEGISVSLILSNKADAYVLTRAERLGVPSVVFDRSDFYENNGVLKRLQGEDIYFLVLAGFLWLVPDNLTKAFPGRILNIHPALLPKYGGKGMYGSRVHEAVKQAGEKETGITIHYVNEKYDEGQIIFQATCDLDGSDTPSSIAAKVHELEYEHYPRVILEVITKYQKM
ncbi:MAG: phosphoribosylglycinamide formyltransferase [Bacteroidota bacterium]